MEGTTAADACTAGFLAKGAASSDSSRGRFTPMEELPFAVSVIGGAAISTPVLEFCGFSEGGVEVMIGV